MKINRNLIFTLIPFLLITLISFFTYFKDRTSYNKFIWDEHYHVASAQKYINHIFFMEPHPPFGKILIAWGEQLLKANKTNDQLLKKMKSEGADLTEDFSFSGYRFFPMLLAWLLAPLLFLCLKKVTKSNFISFIFSLFYAVDNAMIIHFRTAMLDSTLLFLMTLNFYLFLLIREKFLNKENAKFYTILLGVSFGLTMTTKVTGLINIFFPAWLLYLGLKNHVNVYKFISCLIASFIISYCAVWEYHFATGTNLLPTLDAKGYFIKNDAELKDIVDNKQGANPINFFKMLKFNAYSFVHQYETGVPALNLCKSSENGSPFYLWPFGARAIQYVQNTKDGFTKYLYLQSNPTVWYIALLGIVLGIGIFITSCFSDVAIIKEDDKDIFYVLIFSYLGYMGAISQIDRVMYLYHYFPALIFALIITAILSRDIAKIFKFNFSNKIKYCVLTFIALISIITFFLYSPLTYFKPISTDTIQNLSINSAWDLKCPSCERTNYFARPVKEKESDKIFETNLALGNVDSFYVRQEWGTPKIGKSVVDKEVLVNDVKYSYIFGLHANSKVKYRLKGKYNRFTSYVGLPDYLSKEDGGTGSVIFKVIGDGKELWHSSKMESGKKAEYANVNVKGVSILELVIDGTQDGIDYDHGVWLEPKVE